MRWLFESIIFSYLIIIGTLITYLASSFFYRKKFRTYPKLIIIFIILLTISWLVIFYGSFIEPRLIKVVEQNINLTEKPSEQIKIALIADIHVGPYKKEGFTKKVAQKIINQNPDIVLIAGDHVFGKEKYAKYLVGLKKLTDKYPTYAVWGNHEYNIGDPNNLSNFKDKTEFIKKIYQEINVDLINNHNRLIDNKFWLLGVDSVWAGKDNIDLALQNTTNDLPKLLLAHNPDIIYKVVDKNIDIVVAGHTHGGQIRLPLIGQIISVGLDLGREYDYGLFEFSDILLYITKGIGEAGPRARLFSRPEIVILNVNL